MGDWNGNSFVKARKIAVLLIGGAVTIIGIVMIVLPGPAFIVIPAGLGILALEFGWARRWLSQAKAWISAAAQKAKGTTYHSTMSNSESTTHAASQLQLISAVEASRMLKNGEAALIDVREVDEHKQQHVAGATLFPSSIFSIDSFPSANEGQTKLLMCNRGGRATNVANQLCQSGRSDIAIIKGGITAWKSAGLPVVIGAKVQISVMRQVMIAAGSLLLVFTALAAFVNPWFLIGTGFVGAGLFISGATGFCAMATILGKMPWNR
ncbi:MAG: rhodanese-like domain-containing protein [Planctomycetota bacterium]|nr:rhodanese-like domain-containing protein [Planctomycetota bacterium]MDA1261606.1 rhodanese-like domain-containing protein [Planctomycetota bacterium]